MNLDDARKEANWLRRLGSAYRKCFQGAEGKLDPAATLVLGDLYNFCYIGRSPCELGAGLSPQDLAVVEGRRQAYHRIANMLRASDADLYEAALTMAREQRDVLSTEEMT